MRPFSIILVSYNSAGVLPEALASIPAGNEIIVVDNASTDDSVQIAEAANARILRLERNLGFGTACNRGAAIASHDAILFLNPDARLEPGALEALSRAMDAYPHADAFNPFIVDAAGQQYFRDRNRLIDNRRWFRGAPDADRKIPMAVGAAALFRKPAFDALGGFDEDIFLYFEDVDLSARLIATGHDIMHVHDARVVHLIAQSTPRSDAVAAFKNYHFAKAKLHVMRKHGKPVFRRLQAISQGAKWLWAKATGRRGAAISAKNRMKAMMDGRAVD
ncbi:MAG: glycosyltransferase family 2 protein [Rhodobiaceae bacterium]|nr:glycosyltransferase family 2 protein [Rhodobiaceae bacterium]MCC0055813.1 glycosyltransferase family 2 protein [Rhodobiaceae bacterium]